MKRIHIKANNEIKIKVSKDIPLPCQSLPLRQESFEPRKNRATGNTALERAFNKGEREILDQIVNCIKGVLHNGVTSQLDKKSLLCQSFHICHISQHFWLCSSLL
jgi:hypothetical protein